MQDALRFTNRIEFLRKILDIRFSKYSYEIHENAFRKLVDKFLENLKAKFASKESSIILVDPQTRLENRVIELADKTSTDFKAVQEIISHQLDEVESKIRNSQQRLEDNIVEMSRKNVTNFESTKDDSAEKLSDLEKKVVVINQELSTYIQQFAKLTNENFLEQKTALTSLTNSAHHQYFENQKKNDDTLDIVYSKTQDLSKSLEKTNESNKLEFNKVTENCITVLNRMNLFQVGLEQALKKIEDLVRKQSSMDAELMSEKQFLKKMDSKLDELLRVNRDQAIVQQVESDFHTPSTSPNLRRSAFGRLSQKMETSSRDSITGVGDSDIRPI